MYTLHVRIHAVTEQRKQDLFLLSSCQNITVHISIGLKTLHMLIYELKRASQQIRSVTINFVYLFQIPNITHIKPSMSSPLSSPHPPGCLHESCQIS